MTLYVHFYAFLDLRSDLAAQCGRARPGNRVVRAASAQLARRVRLGGSVPPDQSELFQRVRGNERSPCAQFVVVFGGHHQQPPRRGPVLDRVPDGCRHHHRVGTARQRCYLPRPRPTSPPQLSLFVVRWSGSHLCGAGRCIPMWTCDHQAVRPQLVRDERCPSSAAFGRARVT
jgi:hypothetical protein